MRRKTSWAILMIVALVLPMLMIPTSQADSIKNNVKLRRAGAKRSGQDDDAARKRLKRESLTPAQARTKAQLERIALKRQKMKKKKMEKLPRELDASASQRERWAREMSFAGALAAGVAPKISRLDEWEGKTADRRKLAPGIGPKLGRRDDGEIKVDLRRLSPIAKRALESLNPSVIGSPDIVVNGDDEFGLGPTDLGFQSETSIDSNPDGTILVAGYNDLSGFFVADPQGDISISGVARSTDGGLTWTEVATQAGLPGVLGLLPPGDGQVFGDPDVKWSPTLNSGAGGFYYASIFVRNSDGVQGMCVHTSNADGSVWSEPIEVDPTFLPGPVPGPTDDDAADKEFIDVNLATGRIIMSWTNFPGTSPHKGLMESAGKTEQARVAQGVRPVQIFTTFSDDGGQTWSTAVVVGENTTDANGAVQSSIPRFIPGTTNANSQVYVAYRVVFGDDTRTVAVNRSTDGGVTFLGPSGVPIDAPYEGEDQIPGVDRVNNSPAMDVDYDTGRVYVAYQRNNPWNELPFGENPPAPDPPYVVGDIAMRTFIGAPTAPTPQDGPFLINSDPGDDYAQQYPNVAVDQSTGRVWVNFLDQHASEQHLPSGDLFESMTTHSTDGGATWSPPTAISDRPFHAGYGNDSSEPNMGDYNQNVAEGGRLHSVWGGTSRQPRFDECQGVSVMCSPDTYYDKRLETLQVVQLRAMPQSFIEQGGASCSPNTFFDPRERADFTVPLKNYVTNPNNSPNTITGITATLTSNTAGVTIVDGTSAYPNIAPGQTRNNSEPFVVELSSSFVAGTFIDFVLTITSDQGTTRQEFRSETGSPGTQTTLINENFDGATAPGLPAGWTSAVGACSTSPVPCDPWITSDARTPGNQAAFKANDGAATEWIRLFSPTVTIPTPSQSPVPIQSYVTVDFDLNYSLEDDATKLYQAFDGMFLRIFDATTDPNEVTRSVLAEAFASKITTAGIDHYPAHLVRSNDVNYFPDMSVWSDDSIELDDNADGTIHVSMKFPAAGMIGRAVQLRFEYTEDSNSNCLLSGGNGVCGIALDNVVMKHVEVTNGGPSSLVDLAITKDGNPDSVAPGQQVTYHLVVTNNGPDTATGVTVTDFLPQGTVFVSATPSQGSCSNAGNKVTCNLGSINNGANATIDIVAQARGNPRAVSNTARVSSDVCDLNVANNQVAEATNIIGLRKLSFSPPTVTGGCEDSQGTLTIFGTAPQGGLVVNLHAASADVHVPPTVTIPEGQSSVTFTAETDNVPTEQVVNVFARVGSQRIIGRLRLLPIRVVSITFNPNPVHGGQNSIATITLSCAPESPVTVRLTSDRAAAKPPSSIVIPAGQTSGQATIQTLPVNSPRTATITAYANGGFKRGTLTIIP